MNRVILAYCVWDSIKPGPAFMINDLMASEKFIGSVQVCGTLLPIARNECLARIMHLDFTHLLFIDGDIVGVTSELVDKLLEADKDVICPVSVYRKPPYVPHLLKEDLPKLIEQLAKDQQDREIIKVGGVSLSCCLIKKEVLIKTVERAGDNKHCIWFANDRGPRPSFFEETQVKLLELKEDKVDVETAFKAGLSLGINAHVGGAFIGEDYSFCNKVNACGFSCWMDTRFYIGHIGEQAFDIQDWINFNKYQGQGEFKQEIGARIWRKLNDITKPLVVYGSD